MTLIPGAPLMIYQWVEQKGRIPMDYALGSLLFAYVGAHLVFAIVAMRSVLREQGRRFDLAKMTVLSWMPRND